jgi:hypothetical protein
VRFRATTAVVLFAVGLMAALLPTAFAGSASASTPTLSCASLPCAPVQFTEQADGLSAPLPVSSCIRNATCGGEGTLAGGWAGLIALAMLATVATVAAAPRLVRRYRERSSDLPRGVPLALLRPPQPV